MEKMNLGLQLYTLREYLSTPKMFVGTMGIVGEMGYKYIQVSDDYGSPELILSEANKYNLQIGLSHWNDEEIVNETDKVIEIHDKFGCDGIGIGGMPGDYRNYEGYERFFDRYGKAIEKIGKAGKHFCYHNHWFEFERYSNGKTGMEMLLEMAPEGFALTLDTAWAHRAGIDCADFIRKYGDRIYATHLKDLTIINNELTVTEMLTGNMNFTSILEEAQKAGIKWHFMEQDWIRMNAIESCKVSYKNLMDRYSQYLQ